MISLNSLSLIVGIVAGLIAIYSHIRLNKLTPEQSKAYAEESIRAMYPELDALYADYRRTHPKPTYQDTKIPVRTLNQDKEASIPQKPESEDKGA